MGYFSSFFIASDAKLSALGVIAGGNRKGINLAALPPEPYASTRGLSWIDVTHVVGHLSGWGAQRVLAGMNVLIDSGSRDDVYEVRELAADLTLALAAGNTSEESADALTQLPGWDGADTWRDPEDVLQGLQQLRALAVEATSTDQRLLWCCYDTDLLK
jgi:hypothetical protein